MQRKRRPHSEVQNISHKHAQRRNNPTIRVAPTNELREHQTNRYNVRAQEKHLARKPEQIKAYRDTWKLGVHAVPAHPTTLRVGS